MRRLPLMLSSSALVVAIAALLVAATRDMSPGADDFAKRVVVVSHTVASDDSDDKEAKVSCPDGTMLIGGGFDIPHGHDTPGHSLAVYESYPIGAGWDVQAHETDPEAEGRRRWDVASIAYCLRK
jgi:hypothetical protein